MAKHQKKGVWEALVPIAGQHLKRALADQGLTVRGVAKELGLPAWSLYEWRKLYAPRPGESGPAPQTLAEAEKEIGRLRAELIRMREREIVLKKSVGILSETPESGMPRLKR